MRGLNSLESYGIGTTPIHFAKVLCPNGQLYVKLEYVNVTGSIKARTAHYIVSDLIRRQKIKPGMTIVESTSGNLGTALTLFGREIGVNVVCLVDETIPPRKIQKLRDAQAEVRLVELGAHPDFRTARLAEACRLGKLPDWVWPNQYGNEAGMFAHEETTGPEIWKALLGNVDLVVGILGTGGTMCGIARALKKCKPTIKIVAVEPYGSTIFGGVSSSYLSAGAGLPEASQLLHRHGHLIDYFAKVSDMLAIQTCHTIARLEQLNVGITSGAAIAVAMQLAARDPSQIVVVIAPDGAESYEDILQNQFADDACVLAAPEVFDATDWHHTLRRDQ